ISCTCPCEFLARGAAGVASGAPPLHQAPPQVGGQRLRVAIGNGHTEPTPRGRPAPRKALGAARARRAPVAEIEVRQADITKLDVDAIANAANTGLRHGGGVTG